MYTDDERDAQADILGALRLADEPKTAGVVEEVPSATSEFCDAIYGAVLGAGNV